MGDKGETVMGGGSLNRDSTHTGTVSAEGEGASRKERERGRERGGSRDAYVERGSGGEREEDGAAKMAGGWWPFS